MRPTWCCGRCPETTSGGVDCTCAENPRCKGPLCACGHAALDHHGVDGRARRDAGCLGDESREGWCRCPQTATSVAIAAHEAEVVGRILDRIDALHRDHDCDRDGEGWRADCLIIFGGGCARHGCCRECGVPDCPTRRLTAEIRGELSHPRRRP